MMQQTNGFLVSPAAELIGGLLTFLLRCWRLVAARVAVTLIGTTRPPSPSESKLSAGPYPAGRMPTPQFPPPYRVVGFS
jgi:hypothetical protein